MAEHSSSPFQRRYPPELRERAVRMVLETVRERGERFGVVTRVAGQLGIGPESLRNARPSAGRWPTLFGRLAGALPPASSARLSSFRRWQRRVTSTRPISN